jgi:hypothetical protein
MLPSRIPFTMTQAEPTMPSTPPTPSNPSTFSNRARRASVNWTVLLWAIGVPLPIVLIVGLMRGCT